MARYELIIKVENSGEKQNMTTSIPNSTNRTNNRVKIAGEDKLKEISANAVKSLSVNTLKRVADTSASMIFPQQTQDRIDFITSSVETISNIVLLGSNFGVAGLVLAVAKPLVDVGLKTWKYNYNSKIEDIELGVARQRAGFQFNQSRRGS